MRAHGVALLIALTLGACDVPADQRAMSLARCNAETLKLYPDPSQVPDEHIFRANCMRSQGYVLRQGEQHCDRMLSAQREVGCYERVS